MSLEEEIIAAEARRFAAIVKADPAELRECLDEKLVYVHSNSVVEDRETYIAKLVSGERRYLAFAPGARTFRELADGAVACIGELEVRGGSAAAAVVVPLVCTAVYQRVGHWKMVLWHACSAKRP